MAEQMKNYSKTGHGQFCRRSYGHVAREGSEGRIADHNIGSDEKPEGIDEGCHIALGVKTKLCWMQGQFTGTRHENSVSYTVQTRVRRRSGSTSAPCMLEVQPVKSPENVMKGRTLLMLPTPKLNPPQLPLWARDQ